MRTRSLVAEAQLGRRPHLARSEMRPSRGGDDEPSRSGVTRVGIAEEIDDPGRDQRSSQPSGGHSRKNSSAADRADGDELVAVRMHGREAVGDGIENAVTFRHEWPPKFARLPRVTLACALGCRAAPRRSAFRPWRPRPAAAPSCGPLFLTFSMLLATSSGSVTGSCAASTMTSPALMLLRRRALRVDLVDQHAR